MTHEHTHRPTGAPRTLRAALLLAALTGVLIAGMGVGGGATPAAAHDSLISASPNADSTPTEPPAEVTLTFSAEVFTAGSAVQMAVIAPGGEDIVTGSPVIEGTTVTQAISETATPGTFTVQWRVVSSDGHPISDEYTYTLTENSAIAEAPSPSPSISNSSQDVAPSPAASASQAADVHTGPREGTEFLPIMMLVGGLGLVSGALGTVMMVARARRQRDRAEAAAKVKADEGGEPDAH